MTNFGPNTIEGPPLLLNSHPELTEKYLTQEAQSACAKKARFHQNSDGNDYIAVHLSTRVRSDNVEVGFATIAVIVNELARKGYIRSSLTSLSSLALATLPKQHDCSLVCCLLLVPVNKLDQVKEIAGKFLTDEDGLGPALDSLDRELPEGQFFGEFRSSLFVSMNDSIKIGKEAIVENRIQEYLSVLPKGTEVISIRECTSSGLFLIYEVVFYNPLMKSIKEVKIDYIRCRDLIDGHMEEFNLLASVEYIKRDGTTLGRYAPKTIPDLK